MLCSSSHHLTDKRPLLGGKPVQALPHLIVIPGTLRAQWIHELETLFIPKSVDILVYNYLKKGNESFWGKGSQFSESIHGAQNKIIVATHLVNCLPS